MQANYVAKKSAWEAVTFWRVVLFWLIVPLIIMIADIIRLKSESIEFYDDKIIQKSGIFSRNEKKSVFTGVVSVGVQQSFWGRIFNYGDVNVDVMGKWDINTKGISNPRKLQEYLEGYIVSKKSFANVITE